MHVVTLVADVIGLHLPFLEVIRQSHQFDGLRFPGLDELVVATDAEWPDILATHYRHLGHHHLIIHMGGIGTVADLARNSLVYAVYVQLPDQ